MHLNLLNLYIGSHGAKPEPAINQLLIVSKNFVAEVRNGMEG